MTTPLDPLWWAATTKRPVIVGPWTSEMGFEVLYWVPFIAHLRRKFHLDPGQLIIVTRGGAHVWYGALGLQSVELYDYVPPRDLRLMAIEAEVSTASIKQMRQTNFERRLVDLIAERIGIRHYSTLHPSRLYRALEPWWTAQKMGLGGAMESLTFEALPHVPLPVGLGLPEKFIAMRWYQRPTWPMRQEIVDWVHALMLDLASRMPIVVLAPAVHFDDHVDFPVPEHPHIQVIRPEPWTQNLAIQTAILQRAAGFVGTWGGMAQLAVRAGVPTTAFFEKWHSCSYAHKILTEWIGLHMGVPVFVGRPQDAAAVRQIIATDLPLPEAPRGSSS